MLFYDDNEIINKIEKYHSHSFDEDYKLVCYVNIKTKSKVNVNEHIAESINNDIIFEFEIEFG